MTTFHAPHPEPQPRRGLDVHRLQVLRRFVQVFVLLLVLLIPVSARYNNYLAARQLDRNLEKWDGTLQGETLAAVDGVLRALPGGEKQRVDRMVRDRDRALRAAQQLRGGPWSAEIGPLSMTDPLAGAESMVAARRSVPVLWVSLIVPVVLALLLGRVFCSWICPMNLFLELTDKLRRWLRFLELPPSDVRFSRATKYVLLAVGLLVTAVLSIPVLGYVYPPAIIGREAHAFVFGLFDRAEMGRTGLWIGGLTWMSLVLVAIALFEVTVSRRWWCRYVCPGGALYSLLGHKRLVKVKLTAKACTGCAACVPVCQMGLNPMRDKMGTECDSCGLCISHCPGALSYQIDLPRLGRAKPREEMRT